MEIAYIGLSNTNNFILKQNSTAVDLTTVTKMTLTVGSNAIESTNSTASITWNQAGYETGEVRLHLGNQATISTGVYECPLIVYDSTWVNGLFWGNIPLQVKANPEGAT